MSLLLQSTWNTNLRKMTSLIQTEIDRMNTIVNLLKDLIIMVINGSEITRNMPPGHSNAIFIKDANKLITNDPIDA